MKLSDAAANYVNYKQSMGMRFRTEANTLKSFCQALGDITLQEIRRRCAVIPSRSPRNCRCRRPPRRQSTRRQSW
jgi:hypothetical protein